MPRTVLVAVDDSASAHTMFRWLLQQHAEHAGDSNLGLREDDVLHLLHIALRDSSTRALPATDYFDQMHTETAQCVTRQMLEAEYLLPLQAVFPQMAPTLHIVQAAQDAKTISRVICQKAAQLAADEVVIGASSSRSRLATLLSGSIVAYCKKQCSRPLKVVQARSKSSSSSSSQPVPGGRRDPSGELVLSQQQHA